MEERNQTNPTIDKLVTALNLSPVQALWVVSISDKHAIWIGNQIKLNTNLYPKGKAKFEKILAWKKKNPAINLKQYKFENVLKLASDDGKTTFFKEQGSLKNDKISIICEGSKFKWVELFTEEDCVEEGTYMNHCLEHSHTDYIGNGEKLFSLRNVYNKPELTLQVISNEDNDTHAIGQYCADSDDEPDKKFAKYFKYLEKHLLAKYKVKISGISKYENQIITKLSKADRTYEGDLTIDCDNCIYLVSGLTVKGDLHIETADGERLPKNLVVEKDLYLSGCCDVDTIPNGTKIGGDLFVETCSLEYDAKKVKIGGKVYISQ